MKKQHIKGIVSILTFAVLFGGNVYAAKGVTNENTLLRGGDSMSDTPQTAEEQYEEMLEDSDYTEEVCQDFYTKIFDTPSVRASISMTILAVPYCKQETNYYCGPATAKQTISAFNGSAESQDEIWKQIKASSENSTEGDKLRTYLNSQQNTTTYGLVYPASASAMSNDIYYDLNKKIPVVLWVKLTKGGNWLYSTSGGHFLNASGINTGGSLIEVTDPYIGWVDAKTYPSGKYWVTSSEAYSATTARGLGYYK